MTSAARQRLQLIAAFAIVYIVWGRTAIAASDRPGARGIAASGRQGWCPGPRAKQEAQREAGLVTRPGMVP
jgi:hypothetical protein